MRLRKQLLFLSLVTLTLPWVGCQYIREMDTTLRQGQTNSLAATAQAVAARVVSDPALSANIAQYTPLQSPLYAHSLKAPLWLDGYNDDWLSRGLISPSQDASNEPTLAIWQDQLHVFLKIKTASLDYFNPAAANLDQSSHLLLFTRRGNSHNKYALFASAPGQFSVIKYTDDKVVTTKTLEHRIKGHWLEWSQGYQLEISLPLAWAQNGIAFDTHERTQNSTQKHSLTPVLQPIIVESSLLSDELSIFSSRHTRLHIVTNSGHVIASSGRLQKNTKNQQHGFLEWLYALALGNRTFPELPSSYANGVMLADDIWQKLENEEDLESWYQLKSQAIAQTILPIREPDKNRVIGAIIAEQSASSLSDATNNALSRLLAYSFLASTFAGICLVLYATWLSLRIRKLSEAAASAVSENGKISENFPVSKNADEIGDLSRNYAQLLSRLREYTDYLRTLSSTLSHELRTPLAIVLSSLDNLEHEQLDAQAKTYAERARGGASRLSNILNAMSAASRVEQAIDAAEIEAIPCQPFFSYLIQAYKDVYPQTRLELNIQTNEELNVMGSAELLVQAFDKLVDNAADFCPLDGLIEFSLKRHKDSVVFSIRNEGPTLPEHMQGRLFDSMVSVRDKSADQAAKDKSHHLGLGLYIVRLITDFHQGEVEGFNATDNSGVVFEIRLPISQRSNNAQ